MSRLSPVFGLALLSGAFVSACQAQTVILQEENLMPPVNAEILETGILELTHGFKGDVLGAEVVGISLGGDDAVEVIELSIPVDPDKVDRISLFGASGRLIEIDEPIEIIADPENGKVGITLKLSKTRKMGLRIQLIDLPDE